VEDNTNHLIAEGEPVELGQQPTIARFEDLSPAHRRAREAVESAVDTVHAGQKPIPPSIRGPFRTGKTALLYHTFDYAWKNRVPAVYVEAGTLLEQYDETKPFDEWIFEHVDEQVEAILDRDDAAVDWFPAVPPSERLEWLNGTAPDGIDTEQRLILIDEVEQKYTELLGTVGVDDDNPLRRLLDHPELLPVLSMGQLSAFEFVGDADMGRMDPISIPPITIGHIESLLKKRGADPALGRAVFWLTRGRAARVHQVMTEVARNKFAFDNREAIAAWLAGHADETATEFQAVRRLWEDPDISSPRAAAAAVAFDPNGYDDWLIQVPAWYSADDVAEWIEEIVLDSPPFIAPSVDTEDIQEGRQILRESIERVVDGVASPSRGAADSRAIPSEWLTGQDSDTSETLSLLDLIQDFLLAFEAGRPARDVAFDALEESKASFKNKYSAKTATVAANEGSVSMLQLSTLEQAYPPLATDPSRLTPTPTDELEAQLVRGVELTVEAQATVYACPTQEAFAGQLSRIEPDPTHPTVLLVPDSVDIDANLQSTPVAKALNTYDALRVVKVPTTRVWTFVAQLSGRLEQSGRDRYMATEPKVEFLVDEADRREDRTTIEILYDHLSERVAGEAASTAVERHKRQFSVGGVYVWQHSEVAGPSWVNPRAGFSRGRHAVSSLLVLGYEPDWEEDLGLLLPAIRDGLDDDTIDNAGGFKYTELTGQVNEGGGYSAPARRARGVCRSDTDEAPSEVITRLQNALSDVVKASEYDHEAVLAGLFEQESGAGGVATNDTEEFLESLNPFEEAETTDDFLWSAATASLVRDDDQYLEEALEETVSDLDDLVRTVDGYLSDVERAQRLLTPTVGTGSRNLTVEFGRLGDELGPDGSSMGSGKTTEEPTPSVVLETGHLDTYLENLKLTKSALSDAREHLTNDDFRPTAYAFSILANRYEYVLRDAVDELDRGVPDDGDLTNVENLSNTIKSLNELVLEDQVIKLDTAETNEVEVFIDELVDFADICGARISIGNPKGDGISYIHEIDNTARIRTHMVFELQRQLKEIESLQTDIESEFDRSKSVLQALVDLLSNPESQIERTGPVLNDERVDADESANTDDEVSGT
jgi:hypothetical protein